MVRWTGTACFTERTGSFVNGPIVHPVRLATRRHPSDNAASVGAVSEVLEVHRERLGYRMGGRLRRSLSRNVGRTFCTVVALRALVRSRTAAERHVPDRCGTEEFAVATEVRV